MEYNQKQRKADKNIEGAAGDYIFGLMNACLDNDKDSEEYKDYYNALLDLEGLKNVVYVEGTTTVYDEGFIGGSKWAESYLKDIRFCGKEFLEERVAYWCEKYQKEALDELR